MRARPRMDEVRRGEERPRIELARHIQFWQKVGSTLNETMSKMEAQK